MVPYLFSNSKVAKVGRMHMYQEMKFKTVDSVLCSSSTLLVRKEYMCVYVCMHMCICIYMTTKDELYNFGDSTEEFNTLYNWHYATYR